MSQSTTSTLPKWFWIVSGIALLWNLAGASVYLMQVTAGPEAMADYSPEQLEAYSNIPAYATGAFAIAVFAGVLGCVLLLLRKSWAIPVFMLSLAGILVQNFYNFFVSNNIELLGAEAIGMPVAVIIIGFALLWFSRKSQAEGWIS